MAALLAATPVLVAADAPTLAPFSAASPGSSLPAGWTERFIRRVARSQLSLVADAGSTVLEVRSENAAGLAAHAMRAEIAAAPILAWRWKVDRVVAGGDLSRRAGDDYAARVYVFFDVPDGDLSLADRLKLRFARLLHGDDVPAAALCYVWDNRHPVGTRAWNAYTDRVRMVVLQSGTARAGQWVEERRDVAADYREAFGTDRRVPPVSGVGLGNDTDQTGEIAVARFGDVRFEARR